MIRYTCPQCQRQVAVEEREELPTRPFCSRRCQQIDLGKWLSGAYVISDPLPGGTIAPFEGDVPEDGVSD